MSFQTLKTSPFIFRTQIIFDAFRELSDPAIDIKGSYMIKAQKHSKDIVKIIHVTSLVQP